MKNYTCMNMNLDIKDKFLLSMFIPLNILRWIFNALLSRSLYKFGQGREVFRVI
jgi:hypothetical protein